MKIKYANVDNTDYPSFAYIICEENGIMFSPVYNRWNRVDYFTEVEIIHTNKITINEDYIIRKGDACIYAYFCNNIVYLGKKRKIKTLLMSLLYENKISAPFSMLEVVQFLNITGKQKNNVLKLCYDYLSEYNSPEFMRIWADSVEYKKVIRHRPQYLGPPNYNTRESYIGSLHSASLTKNKKAVTGLLTPELI